MKKRVLFFAHGMELGGAERALLGLLEHIDAQRVQAELFLMRHRGELLADVPAQVRLLPEVPQYAGLAVPLRETLGRGQLRVAAGRALGKAIAARRVRQLGLPPDNGVALECSHRYTLPAMPPVGEGTYDWVFSFLAPHYFAANRVRAKRRAAWIHTDYSRLAVDAESEMAMWSSYDVLVSVSEDVTRSFAAVFPGLKDRVVCIESMLPVRSIRRQSAAQVPPELRSDGAIRLLSVGRFCTAKNFDSVPDICRRLREDGLNVRWYLIGYGGDEPLIRRRIEEAGMQEHVVILGRKRNPYPYMRACDLYVQPSRYEGRCVSVCEAQLLGRPVAITAYPTAKSQLEDGVTGVVVPMDNARCAQGIAALLRDPQRMRALARSCLAMDWTQSAQTEKLYRLLEET